MDGSRADRVFVQSQQNSRISSLKLNFQDIPNAESGRSGDRELQDGVVGEGFQSRIHKP